MELVWIVVGILVPLLIGLGVSVLGLTPPEYKFSRYCFWASAVLLGATDVLWHIQSPWRWWWQSCVGIPIWCLILFGLPFAIRYVKRKEGPKRPTENRVKLYDASNNLIDLSVAYVRSTSPRKQIRAGYVLILITVTAILSVSVWSTVTKLLATPFSVVPGAAWMSTSFDTGFYWLVLPYVNKMTPANIMAFYTVTNLKANSAMVSNLYLEIYGAGDQWYKLTTLLPHTGILVSAMLLQHPTDVAEITFPAGFLLDKLENKPLASGASVQGWILCQYPPFYISARSDPAKMRMVIIDTANDKMVVPLAVNPNGYILNSEMDAKKIIMDVRQYEVVSYTSP